MTTMQEGFIDLDQLLADSVSIAEDTKALKKNRDKLTKNWLHSGEKEQLRKEVAAIESRREWENIARSRLFHKQVCAHCGASHTHYMGTFLEQKHLKMHGTRWIRIDDEVAVQKLPAVQKIDEESVEMCIECAGERDKLLEIYK